MISPPYVTRFSFRWRNRHLSAIPVPASSASFAATPNRRKEFAMIKVTLIFVISLLVSGSILGGTASPALAAAPVTERNLSR
jgi:hypothetical protein